MVNKWRPFSDERGLQSLQLLAFITAAQNVSGVLPPTPARTARRARWAAAWAELTNATNAFAENMLNAKIESPIDDNYSDDELMFLPYYTYLSCTTDPAKRAAALASLERSWRCADGRGGESEHHIMHGIVVQPANEADLHSSVAAWTTRMFLPD